MAPFWRAREAGLRGRSLRASAQGRLFASPKGGPLRMTPVYLSPLVRMSLLTAVHPGQRLFLT
jgi:hypothetical protein